MPLVALPVLGGLGHPRAGAFFAEALGERSTRAVQAQLHGLPPEALELIGQAHLAPDDGLVAVLPTLVELPSPAGGLELPRPWLPLAPASLFALLTPQRQQVYLERRLAADPRGGWLLVPRGLAWGRGPVVMLGPDVLPDLPTVLLPALLRARRPGRQLQSAHWQMLEFLPHDGP